MKAESVYCVGKSLKKRISKWTEKPQPWWKRHPFYAELVSVSSK